MRLRFSPLSPFARKVRVTAHELGIQDRIELLPTALRVEGDLDFWRDNPLAKIPVLALDDGCAYYDSTVICEYLDATFGGSRLLPAAGEARWRALTTIALADGVVDAGMLARQETSRPAAQQDARQLALQMAKVARGLDRLQETLASAAPFDMAGVAAACALSWLELRFGAGAVFEPRPHLAAWYGQAAARPSMRATEANAGGAA